MTVTESSSSTHDSSICKADARAKPPKSLCDAYVLALPLGFLGLHHFYLRRYGFWVLYLCTFGLLGVGWVVDWFRLPHLVSVANRKIQNPTIPQKKDLSDAYVLWFPMGFLGLHHFYVRRYGWGVIYFCTFGFLGIGWLVDAFRIPCLVADVNKIITEGDSGYRKKRLDDAYVLCFPLGFLGLHHFYLRRYCWGVLYLCTFGLLGIGWIIDWFRLPCLVAECNKKAELNAHIVNQSINTQPGYNGFGGLSNPAFVTTHTVSAGTYQPPGLPSYQATDYPSQQAGFSAQQHPAALYPQVPPYTGYPAQGAGYSSWSTIASSEVGHRNMESMDEQPPSYQASVMSQPTAAGMENTVKNGKNATMSNAPPLQDKEKP